MATSTNRTHRALRKLWIPVLIGIAIAAFVIIPGCAVYVAGQRVPTYAITADTEDFAIADDVAALHYYGVGGWGVKWRGEYLLMAPYFSNHGFLAMFGKNGPDLAAIVEGVRNTPFSDAGLILVGHGHVDHAADIPAYAAAGLPPNQAGMIANATTLNMLAKIMPPDESFRCAESPLGNDEPTKDCTLRGFRVTPLASQHAPNVKVLGMEFTISKGTVDEPQPQLPARPADYRLGETWAYLIDLLDENDEIVLRIHYMDAVAGSEHSNISASLLQQHKVDIHIACVPGFHYVEDYPEWVMDQGQTGYVLMGHWEDFFQPRDDRLKPVTLVLGESKLNTFARRIESGKSKDARHISPLNKSDDDCPVETEVCGPRGDSWALPIPGETYHFGVRAGL